MIANQEKIPCGSGDERGLYQITKLPILDEQTFALICRFDELREQPQY